MLLRERRFQLLLAGQTTSRLGDTIEPIALAALVVLQGRSAVLLGVVVGLRSLTTILSAPLGGLIADKLPRNRAMMAADAVQVLATGAIAVHPSLGVLLVSAPLTGLAVGVSTSASGALLSQVVDDDQLQRANSIATATSHGVSIAGPALGGVLVAAFGVRAAFLANAATFAVSFACLALIRVEALHDKQTGGLREDLKIGLGEILRRPWAVAIIAAGAVQAPTTWAPGRVVLPLVAIDRYGAGAYGLLLSFQAAGYMIGALVAAAWAPRYPGRVSLAWSALYPVLLIAVAVAAPLPLLYALSLLAGGGLMFFGVTWLTSLQRQIPPERLARVVGLNTLGNFGLEPPGAVAAGALAQAVGSDRVLIGAGVLGLVTTAAPLGVRGVSDFGRNCTVSNDPDRSNKLAA